MSRVTIKELYWEVNRDKYDSNVYNGDVWCDYKDIEIVPRKLVEMIIADCSSKESRFDFNGEDDKRDLMRDVIGYAESLLEQFEQDK